MFNFFCSILFSVSLLNAAAPAPDRIDYLERPTVIAERAGFYKFTLSAIIAANVLDALSAIKSDDSLTSRPAEEFRDLLSSLVYPHPRKVSGVNTLWSGFRETVIELRSALGVSEEALPFFSMSQYEKLSTYQEAIALFKTHLETSTDKLATTLEAEDIKDLISNPLDQIHVKTRKLLAAYADFYSSRPTPFRKHDIERYLIGLLHLNTPPPISLQSFEILDVLQRMGCLELAGSWQDNKFTYSPRAMVKDYITTQCALTTIVLGCGHANTREMLEALRLPTETWCDACDKRPHASAMVVSLDEPSADILCDLNHQDLWLPIETGSVDLVADETWHPNCYTPETFDSIARVLKPNGEFHSNGYAEGCPIKTALLSRGFVVVEANLEARTIKLRKTR